MEDVLCDKRGNSKEKELVRSIWTQGLRGQLELKGSCTREECEVYISQTGGFNEEDTKAIVDVVLLDPKHVFFHPHEEIYYSRT